MVSWKEFTKKLRLLLFQYEVCTSIAVMDFKEKCIIRKFSKRKQEERDNQEEQNQKVTVDFPVFLFPDTLLIAIMSTITYSCYVYLPRCAWRFLIVCGLLTPPANDNILNPGGNHFMMDS
jgi:hypothetical protein